MSERCNNSACFFVEIRNISDISVTFEFYNSPANKEKAVCPAAEKKKTAAGQADFPCLKFIPCGGFKIKAAVLFVISEGMTR